MHKFVFNRTDKLNAIFVCAICEVEIGFNLPGVGEPTAVDLGDGTYATPPKPDQWADPCVP